MPRGEPVLLLLGTGVMLGATFPLGKAAALASIAPVVWAMVLAGGSSAMLFAARLARGRGIGVGPTRLRFYAIAATISLALPNLLVFAAIPHLGAGFTALAFTLSPVFTLALALALRMRRPDALAIGGIAVGFFGAVMVATTRGELGDPAEPIWLLAALAIPASLACGNIYRTAAWPEGAEPIELAIGTNAAALLLLGAYALLVDGALPLGPLASAPLLTATQVLAATGMFALFFRLQQVGGPVYLSQISYVAATVGLVAGTLLFDERYAWITWSGAALIAMGVALTTIAQSRGVIRPLSPPAA
ncbi:MAG: DMT family transporter [Geminicoccaceae bacterium]|nr:DMT family transporter [Geminicoccaceae bacterium]